MVDDDSNYNIRIPDINTNHLYKFTTLSSDKTFLKFNPTNPNYAGSYTVTLVLKDNNVRPMSRTYNF